jgi:hypothetical protein
MNESLWGRLGAEGKLFQAAGAVHEQVEVQVLFGEL